MLETESLLSSLVRIYLPEQFCPISEFTFVKSDIAALSLTKLRSKIRHRREFLRARERKRRSREPRDFKLMSALCGSPPPHHDSSRERAGRLPPRELVLRSATWACASPPFI